MLGALFLLLTLASAAEPYHKVVHNVDKQARCLDGSSPALYVHEGDPKKILIYMQGGGVCGAHSFNETMESCYQRSRTFQGSSIYWPKTTYGEGMFSTDPEKNIFANWTKVIIPYCDGAFHQGATKKPYIYKDAKLYFRGGINTRAHYQYLHNRFNLTQSERIVLTGSSSGGIAALAWSNYLQKMTPNADFKLILDSAILIRIDDSELSNLFKVGNVDENAPHAECAAKYGKENEYHCLSVRGILPYTVGQALFVQSGYDQFMISMRLDLPPCLTAGSNGYSLYRCDESEVQAIQTYRSQEYYPYLQTIIAAGHMLWSIDCSMHSFVNFDHYYSSPNHRVPMHTGITMQEAIKAWMFQGKNVTVYETVGWPNNVPCSH